VTLRNLSVVLDALRHDMDGLREQGIIRKVPLRLVEVS
jgi:hypothetical protein